MLVAITLSVVGLCFVIGWATAYGGRPYLGLVGLGFVVAAAIPIVGHPPARYGIIGATVMIFVLALISAVRHVKGRIAQLRGESVAREQAFFEVFQAAEAQPRSQEDSATEESSPPGGEEGTAP